MLVGNEPRAELQTTKQRERKPASFLFRNSVGMETSQLCPLPSGESMSATPLLLDTKPVRFWGGSYVISLNKLVREALGLKRGDHVAFRRYGRFVFLAVVRPESVMPISKAEAEQARAALGL